MQKHLAFRDRVFLAPPPLSYYVSALRRVGLKVEDVDERTIEADVEECYEFLSAYHDAVLGWVGGSLKVGGAEPSEQAVADRLRLIASRSRRSSAAARRSTAAGRTSSLADRSEAERVERERPRMPQARIELAHAGLQRTLGQPAEGTQPREAVLAILTTTSVRWHRQPDP